MKEPTCAERLPEHLRGRLDDLRMLTAVANGDDGFDLIREFHDYLGVDAVLIDEAPELAREALDNYGLSVERHTVLRWTISTGGPADGFEVTYDQDGDAVRARYWFQDWFDGAELPVDQDTMEMVSDIVNPDGMMLDQHAER